MSFLNKLRLSNVFPKDRAQDTPFGMPDMNQGDNYLDDILSRAHRIELGRETRGNARFQAERNLYGGPKNQPVNRLKQISEQLGVNKPENVVYGGDLGATPTQHRFGAEDATQRNIDFEDKSFKRSVGREDDLAIDKRKQDELAFNRSLMTGGIADDFSRETAETAHQRGLESKDIDNRNATRRGMMEAGARGQASEEAHRRALELERTRGEEQRKTWGTRGEITSNRPALPTQQNADFKNKVQQLTVTNPELAKYLEMNQNTGMVQPRRNTPPDILRQIQMKLGINPNSSGGISDEEADALINEIMGGR